MKLIKVVQKDGHFLSINPKAIILVNTEPNNLKNTVYLSSGTQIEIISGNKESFNFACRQLGVDYE